jgi:UDP-3-O-[3-hydroxymyristoyl] glucosamine N-acyltransferase
MATFLDDAPDRQAPAQGARLLRPDALGPPEGDDWMFVAIGDSARRARLMANYRTVGWRFATLVHPTAVVAADATLGENVIVAAGAVVESATRIGRGVIVDIGVLVDHDCQVADFVHLAAGQVLQPRTVISE